ncbi:MAG: hypothetical protein SWC96_10985 [Thermodesulfobacteriota bacterium]|nr:hypothetical protein [Thermodesulfobacteriota bacterium]
MAGPKAGSAEYVKLSRMVCMLLNRAMMYKADHPQIREAAANLYKELALLLPQVASISLILHRDQLYLDEEPVDPRINVGRIVALFKKAGIQSISFFKGMTAEELDVLIGIVTSPAQYADSAAMIEELRFRGVDQLKINHVFYKKITREEEVITRKDQAKKPVPPPVSDAAKKQLMKTLLESVIAGEADKTLSMQRLMADPAGVSQQMLSTEEKSMAAAASGSLAPGDSGTAGDMAAITPGATLLYQIQSLGDDIRQHLATGGPSDMMDVAEAVFEMKRQLALGIEARKAVNQAYENESAILDQVNSLSDDVLVQLIKNEYQQGKITTVRLAQILRRMVPEPGELRRLLPKIKKALLSEGMPVAEYLSLVQHLGKELESEGLAMVLQEAAGAVGVDGADLIDEIQKNPEQVAGLIAVAAEIRKGDGDRQAFMDMLVHYVEELGSGLRKKTTGEDAADARRLMTDLGSNLTAHLRGMNVDPDTLAEMETRINDRIQAVFDRLDTGPAALGEGGGPARKERTLLEMMEQSLESDQELKQVLQAVRAEAEADTLDENSIEQIYAAIVKHQEARREKESKRQMPAGVLKPAEFRFHLEKELSRAGRHKLYLSTLAFTIISVRPKTKVPADVKIKKADLFAAAYQRLVEVARTSDIVGELDPNTMTIILPMADKAGARLALQRITKMLHDQPFEIQGIPLSVIIAGSVTSFLPDERPNAEAFIRTMAYELDHVAKRVRNIHNLT